MRILMIVLLFCLAPLGASSFLSYQKACINGNSAKCYALGDMFLRGEQVRLDHAEAKRYFEKSCNEGFAKSCVRLGDMYERALGVEKELKKAKAYYEKGAELGDGEGYYHIAQMKKTHNKLYYYALACEYGSANGCFQMKMAYRYGKGVKKSEQLALKYAEKNCKLSKYACATLGSIYEKAELGVKKEFKKAVFYYQKACAVKSAEGCYKLGNMYYFGKGVKQSHTKALKHYKQACDKTGQYGMPKGCNNLAVLYEKGRGVKKDRQKAYAFYKRACDYGYQLACMTLKGFK